MVAEMRRSFRRKDNARSDREENDYQKLRRTANAFLIGLRCPPLRREAIQASKFDSQLNDQARRFLAESEKNDVKSGKLHLSSIFRTYKSDFETTGKTVPEFVDPWFREKTRGMAVEYTKYDWALNDQARGK